MFSGLIYRPPNLSPHAISISPLSLSFSPHLFCHFKQVDCVSYWVFVLCQIVSLKYPWSVRRNVLFVIDLFLVIYGYICIFNWSNFKQTAQVTEFFFFFNVKVTFSTENISIINILIKQKFSNFFMPQNWMNPCKWWIHSGLWLSAEINNCI